MEGEGEKLGEKIRSYRMAINMTQAEFAERLGVTGASVSAYENGIRNPSFDVLVKISSILGVSTDELHGKTKQSKQTIDATGLTEEQLLSIQKMVLFYRHYNQMADALSDQEKKIPPYSFLEPKT